MSDGWIFGLALTVGPVVIVSVALLVRRWAGCNPIL